MIAQKTHEMASLGCSQTVLHIFIPKTLSSPQALREALKKKKVGVPRCQAHQSPASESEDDTTVDGKDLCKRFAQLRVSSGVTETT